MKCPNCGADAYAGSDGFIYLCTGCGRTARAPIEYFEDDPPSQRLPNGGLCSDNNCPCPQVVIPYGTGYLYIEQRLIDFRRQYPTVKSAREAMQGGVKQIVDSSPFGMTTKEQLDP